MNDLLFFLDCISKHKSPNITYTEGYKILYLTLSTTNLNFFIDKICEKIPDHFISIISEFNDEKDNITKFSNIWNRFKFYDKCFLNFFKIAERYLNDFCFSSFLDEHFAKIFKNYFDFDLLSNCFISEFNLFHNSEITKKQRVFEVKNLSSLIFFVYKEKNYEFQKLIKDNLLFFTDEFLNLNSSLNPPELCQEILKYFFLENKYLYFLFQENYAKNFLLSIYQKIINPELEQIKKCFNYLSEACKLKDIEFLSNFYQLINIFQPTQNALKMFSDAIRLQIESEPKDISSCIHSIQWYNNLVHISFKDNPFIYNKIQKGITSLINNDTKTTLKNLSQYINKAFKTDGNIKEIQPILRYLMNKTEFEMLHLRNIIRRILPLSYKKIDKELIISEQIKESSPNFDTKTIESFLSDAKASLSLHIGDVLITRLKIWPFRTSSSEPIYLSTVTNELSAKYKSLFPGRILSFPIQFWVISIKWISNSNVFIANGIQTEIIMYLNENLFIQSDSLEPQISSKILLDWLETLSSNKFPLLLKKENSYIINHDFKPSKKILKLPQNVAHSYDSQEKIRAMRIDSIDSAIVRIMKSKRLLKILELEKEVLEFVSQRFLVNNSDIRERLAFLEKRNYVKIKDEKIYYIP